MAIFTFLWESLVSLTVFNDVAMFLPPPVRDVFINNAVTLPLISRHLKLVYSVKRMKTGGRGFDLRSFLLSWGGGGGGGGKVS